MTSKFEVNDVTTWRPLFKRIDPNFLVDDLRFAFVFGDSGQNAIVITKAGEVLAAGKNNCGCLGVGDEAERKQRTRVVGLSGKKVDAMAAGEDHVMVKTTDGQLLVWGGNRYYQLGNGSTTSVYTPQPCRGLGNRRIKQIACGRFHSMVLTEAAEVWAWGRNDYGQVGCGSTGQQPTPVLVEDLHSVVSIGCSRYTSFALTASGQIYSWGCTIKGPLGIGSSTQYSIPQEVAAPDDTRFKSIACGFRFILAITNDSRLFVWGQNCYGQVGDGTKSTVQTPKHIDVNGLRVKEVAASIFSDLSTARTFCRKVFAWGKCSGVVVLTPQLKNMTSLHEAFAQLSAPVVTYKPLTSDEGEIGAAADGTRILNCLRQNFDSEEFSDVAFIVQDKTITGNRLFLRMRSPYLNKMLSSEWAGGRRKVTVEGHSYAVFRAYLRYLYTEELEVDAVDAVALLHLAEEYLESDLKRDCEEMIRSLVTTDNVLSTYEASIRLSAKDLEQHCFDFTLDHLTDVVESASYGSFDPQLAKDLFLKVVRAKAFKTDALIIQIG